MRRFGVILLSALALVASPLPALAAPPTPPDPKGRPGPAVAARAPMADVAGRNAWRKAPAVSWPAPGVAEVKVAAAAKSTAAKPALTRAGSLPIWLGQSATVRVLQSGKESGLVFSVSGARGDAPIEVDYSGFRYAFGGDYGARLRLERVDGRPVTSRNDLARGRVAATGGDGVYRLAAAQSSSAGTYRATSLAPSATWRVGLGSGDFTWSYPIAAPPMPGPVPELSLSYNSGAVDGRTGATNNQPSIVGEGFELRTGYIERSYQPCSEDGHTGDTNLCYASHNAVAVLPGLTTELVRDATTGKWAAQRESGWRIEQLTGASNGDDDGEHWRLTAPDGTQYHFGSRGPAGSTWTVPVYGDDTGEPCHKSTFAASWCHQGYRWMLDRVVDAHGAEITYTYEKETNHYNRSGTVTSYVRSGHLTTVEYGGGDARIVFTAAGRCVPGTSCDSDQPADFPDVPYDQACASTSCPYPAPTFWSTKRLAKITTQVRVDGEFRDVDSWTLTHSFPATGTGGGDDATPALWLESIVRTGHTGQAVTLPPVRFIGEQRPNRLDAIDNTVPLNKYRIRGIVTETGGQIQVNYALADCVSWSTPAPDSNTRRCFPSFWSPGGTGVVLDWFHKYVVNEVIEEDLVAGQAPNVTRYEYVDPGTVLWTHDDVEILPANQQSWGQWRGYQKVRVRTGPNQVTEHLFLRGLYDDEDSAGAKRLTTVDGVPDRAAFAGMVRQTTVLDGSAVVSRTVAEPVLLGTVATRPRPSGVLEATIADEVAVRTLLTTSSGGVRTVERRFGYDDRGRLIHTSDLGDTATEDDDTCVRRTYTENTTAWIIDKVTREHTLDAACDAEGDTLTDVHNTYNDAGDLTKVEKWNGTGLVTTSRTVPDEYGRPLEVYDGLGHLTRTAYTPATGGPVTGTAVTNALGHTVTTTLDPLRGSELSTTDANGNVTRRAYDALGRLTAVWLPGRASTATANLRYEYRVRADAPAAVTTRPLIGPVRHELYDGLLRPVQTQTASPVGGRIVTDTVYDGAGRVVREVAAHWDAGTPGLTPLAVPSAPDRETRYTYDGAGRVTAEALYSAGAQKRRTTTAYGGDRIDIDPPQGETATTKLLDGHGRTVELRQYAAGAPTGEYDATRYSYTKLGQLATVTDPAGNVRRYEYDKLGRHTAEEGPDTGRVVQAYDVADRLVSRTDARGRTLTYSYDDLDRRTAVREGDTTLASWAYDTAPGGKGLLARATRHAGGAEYVTAVTGYDARGRRTGTAVTIPAVETGLAGTYTTRFTYNEDDQPATVTLPAAGGLAEETLTHGYDALGNLTTLHGQAPYLAEASYDELGDIYFRSSGPPGRQVHRMYAWNPATRELDYLSAYRDVAAEPTLLDRAYGYDEAGNVTSIVDVTEQGTDRQCLRYDHLRRLVRAWTPTGGCSAEPATGSLGGPAPYWHDYGYDRIGNRLEEVWHAPSGDTTRTYTYGPTQPHLVRSVTTNGSATDTYGYDAAGNNTTRPGHTLAWDAEGRVASTGTESYVYDADGERLIRRDGGGVTLYLGHTEVHRSSSGVVTARRYYEAGGSTLAVRTPTRLSWLVQDHHGTAAVAVADQAGQPVSRRYQLPFGGARGAAPAWWDGERGFVGGTTGPAGLVHLGAREYDPSTGRFISADPVVDTTDPQQMHGYSYANGNPVTMSDPDGRYAAIVTTATRLVLSSFYNYLNQPSSYYDYMHPPGSFHTVTPPPPPKVEQGGYTLCAVCDFYGSTVWDYPVYYVDTTIPPTQSYEPVRCGGWAGQCVKERPSQWYTYGEKPKGPRFPTTPVGSNLLYPGFTGQIIPVGLPKEPTLILATSSSSSSQTR